MKPSYYLYIVVGLGSLSACQPQITPRTEPETSVAASAGKTWDALVDYATANHFPIKNTDRASGLLTTEMMSLDNFGFSERQSLGKCALMETTRTATATFVVRGDSTRSTIRASAYLVSDQGKQCESTNVLEVAWERAVRDKAQGTKNP